MGFFAPSPRPKPLHRPLRSRTTHEVLPPNPSITAAVTYLAQRPEFARPPDSCLIVARKAMRLQASTVLTLCRYRYDDSSQSGRVVTGAEPWAYLGEAANAVSHDDYLLAYCGWHYLYCGQDSKPITTRIIKRPITLPNLQSAIATAEYRIGAEVLIQFEGVDAQGEPVGGATDGTTTTSIPRVPGSSGFPWIYVLLGTKLNGMAVGPEMGASAPAPPDDEPPFPA